MYREQNIWAFRALSFNLKRVLRISSTLAVNYYNVILIDIICRLFLTDLYVKELPELRKRYISAYDAIEPPRIMSSLVLWTRLLNKCFILGIIFMGWRKYYACVDLTGIKERNMLIPLSHCLRISMTILIPFSARAKFLTTCMSSMTHWKFSYSDVIMNYFNLLS